MEKIKIMKVTDDKLVATVEELADRIWREHYTSMIGMDQVEYMLDKIQSKDAISKQIQDEGYLYYLLQDKNGGWIGYLAVVPRQNELFLSKFYIRAGDRGKGYGKYAMEFIKSIAKEKSLYKITLVTNKRNKNSINAYKRFGFIITAPVVTDIGDGFVMDDYKMELNLKA
jgi:RimJ/RimL family protein N-acetyltransferase